MDRLIFETVVNDEPTARLERDVSRVGTTEIAKDIDDFLGGGQGFDFGVLIKSTQEDGEYHRVWLDMPRKRRLAVVAALKTEC